MNFGKLNKRITIKSPPTGVDAGNEPTGSWATVATVWANMKYSGGSEGVKADEIVSQNNVEFTIRYRSGVTAAMRIYIGSESYEIKYSEIIGRNQYLKIYTVKSDNQ